MQATGRSFSRRFMDFDIGFVSFPPGEDCFSGDGRLKKRLAQELSITNRNRGLPVRVGVNGV